MREGVGLQRGGPTQGLESGRHTSEGPSRELTATPTIIEIVLTYWALAMCQTLFYMLYLYSFILSVALRGRYTVIIPILQMSKLRHRGIKYLAQGHTTSKYWSLDVRPGTMASECRKQ